MNISKEQLKSILVALVDEMPLPERADGQLSDADVAALKRSLLNGFSDALSQMFWTSRLVVCSLPNNVEVILKVDAVQCPSCHRYFCSKHNLSTCSGCGAAL